MNLNNLSEKQLRVIAEALDLYSRVIAGQIEEVERVVEIKGCCSSRPFEPTNRDTIREAVGILKAVLFPELHRAAAYGVAAPELHQDAKVAYEVYKVIDKHLHSTAPVNQGDILRVTDEQLPSINSSIPTFLDEALNSGDGTYKP